MLLTMPDMLARLYDLPDAKPVIARLRERGITVVRANLADREAVIAFTATRFPTWEREVTLAFDTDPPHCFVACQGDTVVGFAAYDVACRNFFGPMGVAPEAQSAGIGTGLLLSALSAQARQGYAYAIIGGVGPQAFYRKTIDAQLIENSTPGIYTGSDCA